MKQSSVPWLLLTAAAMFIASVALLGYWGWNYLRQSPPETPVSAADTSRTSFLRDSLQKGYNAALQRINASLRDSAGNPGEMDPARLREVYRLRDEIPGLLNNPTAADLDSARLKIAALQGKLDELQSRTARIETENKRLVEELARLRNGARPLPGTRPPPAAPDISQGAEPPSPALAEARLWAVNAGGQATAEAASAQGLHGSFTVRSTGGQPILDVFVVVVQPDSRVLRTDDWESGAFNTPSGSRLYSTKVRYSESSGEGRRVDFRLRADDLQPGSYALHLYANGRMVARAGLNLR